MFFGLPARTRNTMVETYGALLCGRRCCQLSGSNLPSAAILSMSPASASVTTSAGSPSMTARAWRPEPPCDWLMRTSWPVVCFQCFAKATLMSS